MGTPDLQGTHTWPLLGLGPTTFSADSRCQTPGLGLKSQGEAHLDSSSGIVLAPRIVKFLHQELTLSHSTWILNTALPSWGSPATPPVYPSVFAPLSQNAFLSGFSY